MEIAILTAIGTLAAVAVFRANALKQERQGCSIQGFIKDFEGQNCSLAAVKLAYDDLFKEVRYPVKGSDLLRTDLELSSEDIYEMLRDRGRASGIKTTVHPSFLAEFPIETVDDYVRFVESVLSGSI